MKEFLHHHQSVIFLGIMVIMIGVIATAQYVQLTSTSTRSKAAMGEVINTDSIATGSAVVKKGGVTRFSLYSDGGYLYKTENKGLPGATELMVENPPIDTEIVQNDVLGESTTRESGGLEQFLPPDVVKHTKLKKSKKDSDDTFLQRRGIKSSKEHFVYEQVYENIPIYGGQLAVHIKNANEIYALDGSLIENPTVPSAQISSENARQTALTEAKKEMGEIEDFVVKEEKQYIFNTAIIGSGEDKDYLVLAVTVGVMNPQIPFLMQYFVDLGSGAILYRNSFIRDAMSRVLVDLNDCIEGADGVETCRVLRREGDSSTNDRDTDQVYDFLGETYNYYFSHFGRDSFDNAGSPLVAFVHGTNENLPEFGCPNAAWMGRPVNIMVYCNNMTQKDITAHEVTHGIVQNSADLLFESQSGALDEGIADVFAQGVDNNWEMGEGSVLGVFRNLQDPTRSPDIPQADRLFSELYVCKQPGETCGLLNDYCGRHWNNGVVNKMFYLLTEGGEFNGCSVQGIGSEKSHAVIYRALTTYLLQSANFKSLYEASVRACNDLYGESSRDCIQVQNAFKATEMDQQPEFEQNGASCVGRTRQTPQCQQASNNPTPTPTSTQSLSPTPTRTPTPTQGAQSTPVPTPTSVSTTTGKSIILSVQLQGIGTSENNSPRATQRDISIVLSNSQNEEVAEEEGELEYQSLKGSFKATIELTDIEPGDYLIKVTVPGYLSKRVPTILHISSSTNTYTLPTVILTPGDVNGDNVSDILDYNSIASCFGNLSSTRSCSNAEAADLNDDGRTDGVDLNLLLRGLSVREGD